MKKQTILLLAAGLLMLGVLYGLKEYFRTNKDLADEKAVAQLQAATLIRAFEIDSAQSNRQYVDKVVAVNGRVKTIQAKDNPVVITLGEENNLSSVQCSMDSTHADAYKTVAVGKLVTVKGLCTGAISDDLFGTDVKLNRCVIQQQ